MPETTPMILLLAAGHSSRMRGQDKLMQEVAGQPLLRVMAQRACKVGVPVRVVLGAAQSARRDALAGLDVEIVEALDGDGMAASIRAGVAGVTGPVMLVLADMPEITAYDLYLMVTLSGRAPKAILRAASKAGAPGHPVLFPADLVGQLAQLSGDEGAKRILSQEASRVHLVPLADDRALVDLDTPEDWAAWRAKHP